MRPLGGGGQVVEDARGCPRLDQILLAEDGELSFDRIRQIRAHLANCDACQRLLEHLEQSSFLEELEFSEMHARFRVRLEAAKRTRHALETIDAPQDFWIAVAAVIAVLLLMLQ
jgi:anti-sigma factor RsiW